MDAAAKQATLQQLPWPAIVAWAGVTIAERGRRYARTGQVQELAVTDDGALLAWVQGTWRYATSVDLDEAGLLAACTCPYEGVCKHAVALLLAVQAVGSQQPLLTATAGDPRLALLAGLVAEDDEDDDGRGDAAPPAGVAAASLHAYLDGLPRERLVRLLAELAERVPAVADALAARQHLAVAGARPLVEEARRLLSRGGPRYGWYDDWGDAGDAADYDALRDRLRLPLVQG